MQKPPRRILRERRRPDPRPAPPADPGRFAVLVPHMRYIEPECDRELRAVEAMGVPVVRHGGCSAIDFCRSQLLSIAMSEGKEAVLFIDSDIVFNARDALRILGRPEPIVAGVYPQKRFGKMNVNWLDPGPVAFGEGGGDRRAMHVGAGFLRVRAEACMRIVEHHDLPCCTGGPDSAAVWPFFLPQIIREESGAFRYLGEDFSFCQRAIDAGLDIVVDTTIRLFHVGPWPFSWEEGRGTRIDRHGTVVIGG